MIQLLKIEWLKFRRYRAFWVLASAFVILFPLTFYFVAHKYMEAISQRNDEANMLNSIMGAPFVFPKVWHSASWFGGLFIIILGMLFILLITNEVQYRTHRQNIIDGWSRTEFIVAKFYVMLCIVVLSTLWVFTSGLIVGLIQTPSTSTAGIFDNLHYIGYFALMALHYLMVAFMTAILIKRTGLSIIIYFVVVIIIDFILWAVFTIRDSQVGYYILMESSDSLVPNPFKPAMMERRKVSDLSLLITTTSYILFFGWGLLTIFKKADLKT